MSHKARLICLLFVSLVGGCANPGVVKLSPDTYMLARQDRAGIFGNSARLKAKVIQEANEFAAKQGKIAIPLATNEIPMEPGRFASFEYQFRVVEPGDAEAQRTSLAPHPQRVVIENTENKKLDVTTRDESIERKDVYTELIKLDDLRKRGIITDSEYDQQKRKLLDLM